MAEVRPALEAHGLTLAVEKIAPWGGFLRDLFTAMWDGQALEPPEGVARQVFYRGTAEAAFKVWFRSAGTNELKARQLADALERWGEGHTRPTILVDDANGVTASMVPWLVQLERHCTLVVCVVPDTLRKAGTRRAWQLFERLDLGPLSPAEAGELADELTRAYSVRAEDPRAYRANLLRAAQGSPGELARLVRHVAPEALVRTKDVLTLGQSYADREERGVVLAPFLVALGALGIAWRYVAHARGDYDAYVLAGIVIGLFAVLRLLGGNVFRPRRST